MLRERWFTLRNEAIAFLGRLAVSGIRATALELKHRIVVRWWEGVEHDTISSS